MLGEAILWAVIVLVLVVYTASLWIPQGTRERLARRVRRLVGRAPR
jgi:hypothetical protein